MTTTFKSKTFKVYYFPQDADKRDLFLSLYATETTVKSPEEEDKFYSGLNHEANLLIVEI
jgi:hypothetical protein